MSILEWYVHGPSCPKVSVSPSSCAAPVCELKFTRKCHLYLVYQTDAVLFHPKCLGELSKNIISRNYMKLSIIRGTISSIYIYPFTYLHRLHTHLLPTYLFLNLTLSPIYLVTQCSVSESLNRLNFDSFETHLRNQPLVSRRAARIIFMTTRTRNGPKFVFLFNNSGNAFWPRNCNSKYFVNLELPGTYSFVAAEPFIFLSASQQKVIEKNQTALFLAKKCSTPSESQQHTFPRVRCYSNCWREKSRRAISTTITINCTVTPNLKTFWSRLPGNIYEGYETQAERPYVDVSWWVEWVNEFGVGWTSSRQHSIAFFFYLKKSLLWFILAWFCVIFMLSCRRSAAQIKVALKTLTTEVVREREAYSFHSIVGKTLWLILLGHGTQSQNTRRLTPRTVQYVQDFFSKLQSTFFTIKDIF